MNKDNKRQLLAISILGIWLAACTFTLWWYQFRHINAFENYLANFDGKQIAQTHIKPKTGHALVVHFIDPDCPCSRFSKRHIQTLESDFAHVAEFINAGNTTAGDQRIALQHINVPATPAVAIWNSSGELSYFGPYSSGALCGQGKDFVASTLQAIAQNYNPRWINQDAVGCFCPRTKMTPSIRST